MSERETKKLTTPSGREFEVKAYLTARELNELRGVYLECVKVDTQNAQPTIGEISGATLERAEHKLIQLLATSLDGSAENVLDRLLDGMPEDYDFVVAECNKAGNFKPAK